MPEDIGRRRKHEHAMTENAVCSSDLGESTLAFHGYDITWGNHELQGVANETKDTI
jgi:hypothetical protein